MRFLPKNLYSRLTLITVVTAITWYAIIYAWTYTDPAPVTNWQALTANWWNAVVESLFFKRSGTSDISFNWGNMGIWVTPSQKLSVAGIVESTTGGFKFPDGSIQTKSSSPWLLCGNANSDGDGVNDIYGCVEASKADRQWTWDENMTIKYRPINCYVTWNTYALSSGRSMYWDTSVKNWKTFWDGVVSTCADGTTLIANFN